MSEHLLLHDLQNLTTPTCRRWIRLVGLEKRNAAVEVCNEAVSSDPRDMFWPTYVAHQEYNRATMNIWGFQEVNNRSQQYYLARYHPQNTLYQGWGSFSMEEVRSMLPTMISTNSCAAETHRFADLIIISSRIVVWTDDPSSRFMVVWLWSQSVSKTGRSNVSLTWRNLEAKLAATH